MIYEALSTLKDPNGSDTTAIVSFIEVRLKYWFIFISFLCFFVH